MGVEDRTSGLREGHDRSKEEEASRRSMLAGRSLAVFRMARTMSDIMLLYYYSDR